MDNFEFKILSENIYDLEGAISLILRDGVVTSYKIVDNVLALHFSREEKDISFPTALTYHELTPVIRRWLNSVKPLGEAPDIDGTVRPTAWKIIKPAYCSFKLAFTVQPEWAIYSK